VTTHLAVQTGVRLQGPEGAETICRAGTDALEAIASGLVDRSWQVYHARADRWLPVSTHPWFRTLAAATTPPRGRRSDELVLILPNPGRVLGTGPGRDPLDSGPHLSITEIERVLGARLTRPEETDAREALARHTMPPARSLPREGGSTPASAGPSPTDRERKELRMLRRCLVLTVGLLVLTSVLATNLYVQRQLLERQLASTRSAPIETGAPGAQGR